MLDEPAAASATSRANQKNSAASEKLRVLIINPNQAFNLNWTLDALLRKLPDHDIEVDMATTDTSGKHSIFVRVATRLWFRWVGPALIENTLRQVLSHRYAAVIGIDPGGIVVAEKISKFFGIPLVYLSFEILAEEDITTDVHEIKQREIAATSKASFAIVQDDERTDLFCKSNQYPAEKVVHVPVSPLPQEVKPNNYFRDTLGLDQAQKIVLLAGKLDHWSSLTFIEEIVSFWPDEFVLVIQSYAESGSRLQNYTRRLTQTKRIFLSPPVELESLLNVVGSADFGFAPYKWTPEYWLTHLNMYHLGLSSGKVSTYAICGLPILASSLPVFDSNFQEYRCGEVYKRISDTGDLLRKMNANYESYSAESKRFYREKLDPSKGIEAIAMKLKETILQKG